jgi:hypothetical protein
MSDVLPLRRTRFLTRAAGRLTSRNRRPVAEKSDRHSSSRSLAPIEGISKRKGSNLDASIEARS